MRVSDNELVELVGDYGEAFATFHYAENECGPGQDIEPARELFKATYALLVAILGRDPTDDEAIRALPESVGYILRKYPE